jgi:hypothetical protein
MSKIETNAGQSSPEVPCSAIFILRGLNIHGVWSDICRSADEAVVRHEEAGYRQTFPPTSPGGWKEFHVIRQRVYEDVLKPNTKAHQSKVINDESNRKV